MAMLLEPETCEREELGTKPDTYDKSDTVQPGITESRTKLRKYQELQVPAVCEWTLDDGTLCGCSFTDVPNFSSHVKSHLDTTEVSALSLCRWSGCDFITRTRATVVQHILFHPFHSYLKLLGSELLAKFNLPLCQIDEQYKNVVPPLTMSLKCQWFNKEFCTAVFESVGEFYGHVRGHVMLQDPHACHCRWKGTCMCTIS